MVARNASWLAMLLILISTSARAQQHQAERWLEQLRDPAPSYRAQAALELSRLGSVHKDQLPALYNRLDDPDANVRLCVVHALGNLADQPVASGRQLLPLLSDEDEHVRYAAEWALGRLAQLPVAAEHIRPMRSLLEDAVRSLQSRPHHAGHRAAMEQALVRLTAREAQIDQRHKQQANQRELKRQAELQIKIANFRKIESAFELSSAPEQLKLIDQLATQPDADLKITTREVRANVLKQAMLRWEATSVRFALDRWGVDGHHAVQEIFNNLPAEVVLPEWTTFVFNHYTPVIRDDVYRLAQMVQRPENPLTVREAAAQALARCRLDDPESLVCIESLLDSGQDIELRRLAARLLADRLCVHDRPYQTEERRRIVDRLLGIVERTQEDWQLRMASAAAAAQLATDATELAASLVTIAETERLSDYDLADVLRALGKLDVEAPWIDSLLVRGLSSDYEFTRCAAAEAVASMGRETGPIVERLLNILEDPHESTLVQESACRALDVMSADPIHQLSERMLVADAASQRTQLQAIARLGAQALPAVGACTDLLVADNTSPDIKCLAALSLSQIDGNSSRSMSALRQVMHSTTADSTRAATVFALARLGDLSSDEIRTIATDYRDAPTQVATAMAQQLSGDSRGLQSLLQMLDGDSDLLVRSAVQDLGHAAQESLLTAVKDTRLTTGQRVAAMDLLVDIPRDDYTPLLQILAEPDIGEACADCLSSLALEPNPQLLAQAVHQLRSSSDEISQTNLLRLINNMQAGVGAAGDEGLLTQSEFANSLQLQLDLDPIAPVSTTTIPLAAEALHEIAVPAAGESVAPENLVSTGAIGEESASATDLDLPEGSTDALLAEVTAPETADEPEIDSPFPPAAGEASEVGSTVASRLAARGGTTRTNREATRLQVFYGTNRAPILGDEAVSIAGTTPGRPSHKVVAILAAVATIAVCLFGFLRQRSVIYTMFAVCGLTFVTWVGLRGDMDVSEIEAVPQAAASVPAPVDVAYGAEFSNQLSLGVCEVSIPPNHVAGELESPSVFRFEFRQDPNKHVVLAKTTKLPSDNFFQRLDETLDRKGNNLLVFVHGYNVSFEDAARRTAQMAHDLKYPGAPVFYSWPSQANWYKYQLDRKNIQLSVGHIKRFLLELAEKTNADSINLVAHSMGNVGLTSALGEINPFDSDVRFNQVVLAAPDIDADLFRTRIAPKITNKAERITVYTSSSDLALVASRYFNAGRRAGESGSPVLAYPGIDVVDASAVDTSLLGHSYYGSISVLNDISELLMNRPVHDRTFLRTATADGNAYWVFDSPFMARSPAAAPSF